jgi:heme oxygenase (biliverdin-IX-beta and delta-forming)
MAMTQVPTEAARSPGRARKAGKEPVRPIHRKLRDATREDHASIDRMLLRFDLNRTADYILFLNIHLAALCTVQAEWRAGDDNDFNGMLDCLTADLAALGVPASRPMRTPVPTTEAMGLGIAYVVRGSRLGAAVLRRDVVAELPTSYLDFAPAVSWREFLVELETIAAVPSEVEEAAGAAHRTFKAFADEYTRLQR